MNLASNFFRCNMFQVNSYRFLRLITIVTQVYNFPMLHCDDLSLIKTIQSQESLLHKSIRDEHFATSMQWQHTDHFDTSFPGWKKAPFALCTNCN